MSRRPLGYLAGSTPPAPVPGSGMVLGAAVAPYPDRTETYAQAYTSHNTDIGVTMGCLRSYSTGAEAWPTTWANLGGNHPRQGDWEHRWSWHSMKNDPISIASGAQHQNIVNFVNSIPVTGYKRLLTWWHEPDVGTKIPGTMSNAQAKQMLYEAGRAVRDANHPDVLYGPIFGSSFTIAKTDQIIAATSVTTAALASVCDFVGWDPYNLASQNDDYSAAKQGAAGAAFYLNTCIDWNATNFPGVPLAIGEFGYRPNQADLTMRPAFLQAYVDRCAAVGALCVCYFDDVVKVQAENFIRIYSNPRTPRATNITAAWAADTASIAKWAALYAQYPAYAS